jgi:hypothetical protein
VAEAMHLQSLGTSPYAGSVFHAPPLVLQLLGSLRASGTSPHVEHAPTAQDRHPGYSDCPCTPLLHTLCVS